MIKIIHSSIVGKPTKSARDQIIIAPTVNHIPQEKTDIKWLVEATAFLCFVQKIVCYVILQ